MAQANQSQRKYACNRIKDMLERELQTLGNECVPRNPARGRDDVRKRLAEQGKLPTAPAKVLRALEDAAQKAINQLRDPHRHGVDRIVTERGGSYFVIPVGNPAYNDHCRAMEDAVMDQLKADRETRDRQRRALEAEADKACDAVMLGDTEEMQQAIADFQKAVDDIAAGGA